MSDLEHMIFSNHISFHIAIIFSGRRSKLAKHHLKEVGELLMKIDPNLCEIAKKSIPGKANNLPDIPKKRKGSGALDDLDHVPKKKSSQSHDRSETMTLSQREEKAMNNLTKHIIDLGGKLTLAPL